MKVHRTMWLGFLSLVLGIGQLYLAQTGVGNRTIHLWLAGMFLLGAAYLIIASARKG